MVSFKPQHQGQEHPGIAKADGLLQAPLLTLSIMQRAAPADLPRYRAKVRQQLQEAVDFAMKLADEFSR
ncbi:MULTISPECIES: hypothetical protein [unclassified Bradyrhizobium]|uniref:hypothetical protein n=1 Tax=unclassified Bradyrhizobium TaxID=2631580 RepID=UPI0028EFD29A|nr:MULTISPECIES: hypothetical protein [unclassified Bradyrhizobium]